MKQSIKRIINRTADSISVFFPYFFIFYIIITILSYFFISIRNFFYWPGVNVGILFLAIISLISPKGRKRWGGLSPKNLLVFIRQSSNLIFSWVKNRIFFPFHKFKALSWVNRFEIVLIILVGILALAHKISVIDLFVLIYGLTTVFFGLWPKSSAIFVLILLILCPILLILKKDSMAEGMAIYAYYFLIIAVVVGIRELIQENLRNWKGGDKKLSTD